VLAHRLQNVSNASLFTEGSTYPVKYMTHLSGVVATTQRETVKKASTKPSSREIVELIVGMSESMFSEKNEVKSLRRWRELAAGSAARTIKGSTNFRQHWRSGF